MSCGNALRLALARTGCVAILLSAAGAAAEESGPTFSYSPTADNGPSHWGSLSESYSKCSDGQQQSPAYFDRDLSPNPGGPDIPEAYAYNDALKYYVNYKPTEFKLVDKGYNIEAEALDSGNSIKVDNKHVYTLVQFHFHSPKEHRTIDQRYELPMEMHLVHKRTDDPSKLFVVAVYMNPPVPNTIMDDWSAKLEPVFARMKFARRYPGKDIALPDPIDLTMLVRARNIKRYQGSKTTPGCEEDVSWSIKSEAEFITISQAQLDTFRSLFPIGNARPTQPRNGRVITFSSQSLPPHERWPEPGHKIVHPGR